MAKDLYQNTKRNEQSDSNERRRRNKKRGNRIIGIAALSLLLTACGVPSGRAEETQSADAKEEQEEWPEHYSCRVQERRVSLFGSMEVPIPSQSVRGGEGAIWGRQLKKEVLRICCQCLSESNISA